MRLRRSKTGGETAAARKRQSDETRMPVKATFNYRARRAEHTINLGRQDQIKLSKLTAKRFWLQRFGLIILLISILASLINLLSLSSIADVEPAIAGQNLSASTRSIYEAAVSHILGRSVLNGNKLTVNTSKISSDLLLNFPDLDSASVTIPLAAHHLVVYVAQAQPSLILSAASGAFIIDSHGKATLAAANPRALKAATLPVVTDQSGLKPKLNQQALPTTYVSFIKEVVAQLLAKNFSISSMTLPASTGEMDVYLANQPYFVKFNLEDNDARQQVGTFLATIALLQSQHVTPASYVDVRVDGRAYYK